MESMVNGMRMAYDESGEGLPVLWVHGYPLDRSLWEPQVRGLAQGVRHIVPDLRGFGASEAPPGVYSMETYAADLLALLDRLSVERAVLAGLSMGGYIALAFARLYPRRLRGLILANTRAAPDTPEAARARRENAERALRDGARPVVEPMLAKLLAPASAAGRPEVVRHVEGMLLSARPQGVAGALLGMAERPDSRPFLPDIAVPVLLLAGAEDAVIPAAELAEMAAQIPGARLAVLEDAGHLSNLEQEERFNAEVLGFLKQWMT